MSDQIPSDPAVTVATVTYDSLLQKILESDQYSSWKEVGAGRYRDPSLENPAEQLTRFGIYDYKAEKITTTLLQLGKSLGLELPAGKKAKSRVAKETKGIDEARTKKLELIHKRLGIGIDETEEQKAGIEESRKKWGGHQWPVIERYFKGRGIDLGMKFFWQLRATVQNYTPKDKDPICEIVIPLCNVDGDLVQILKIQINPATGEKVVGGKRLLLSADQDRAIVWAGKLGVKANTVLIFEGLENALSVYQAILKVQGEEEVAKYHFCVSCGTSGLGKLGAVIAGYGHKIMFCDPDAAETSLIKSVVLGDGVERRAIKPGIEQGKDCNAVLQADGDDGLMKWVEELRFVPWWELEEKIAASAQTEENEAERDSFEYHRTWNPFSDQGAARYFLARFGRRVKITEDSRWWIWNGKVWSGENHSKATIRAWIASLLPTYLKMSTDQRLSEAEQKVARTFARSLGSASRQSSILLCIPGMEGIQAQVEDFDASPDLLNLHNGVLELSSGRLLPHNPTLMCSKICRASWNPGATAPVFDRFLSDISCADTTTDSGDVELWFYKLRQLGYLLSGYNTEKVLFFHTGETGDNGKSVEARLLLWLLGDYSRAISAEMLLESAGGSMDANVLYQVAFLQGVRLVVASEANENMTWSEANVKTLTGSDVIIGRHIGKAPFQFTPRFRVVVHGNSRPRVKGGDRALWRRLQCIPYDFQAVEPDVHILEKMQLEADGILQRLYAGFREWRAVGLAPPARVLASIDEYKHESAGILEEFIQDRCEVNESAKCRASNLYSEYHRYCKNLGMDFVENQTNFGRKLSTLGYLRVKTSGIVYRLGLAVKGDFGVIDSD